MTKATNTLRAFLYVRISDDRKGGAGVARQTDDGTALARRSGAHVVRTFNDNDRSATKGLDQRPEYVSMIQAVAAGECDVVIAYSQERLWRDEVEHPLFMRLAREAGVRVLLVNGGEVDPNDANHMLVSTIMNAVAVMESATTKRRVNRELIDRRKRGEWLGGPRAYGHNNDRTALNVTEARLINEACDRVLNGESLGAIVGDYARRGITTAGKCKAFSVTTLGQLLRQPRLAGLTETSGTKYTRAKDGTAGQQLKRAKWPVIVEPNKWRDVVHVLNARGGKRPPGRQHLLSGGFLACSVCGTTLHGARNTRGKDGHARPLYVCPPSTRIDGACGGVSIDGARTDDYIVDALLTRLDTEAFAKAIKRAIKNQTNTDLASAVTSLDRKRARLDDVEAMFTDGELDRSEYKRMRATLRDDIERLEREVQAFDGGPPVHLVGDGARLREAWEHMTFTERRDVLVTMLAPVSVSPTVRGKRWHESRLSSLEIAWRY